MGFRLYGQTAPIIQDNVIATTTSYTSFYGAYMQYMYDAMVFSGNEIDVANGGYGCYLRDIYGSTGSRGRVYNNFIHVGGTGTAYALWGEYVYSVDMVHNSVHVSSSHTTAGRALHFRYGGSSLSFLNNIFANTGGGYAVYQSVPSSVASSDYNNIYSSVGSTLAYWSGDRVDLAALQSVSGEDANSLSVNPLFVSNSDLHTSQVNLDGVGTPVSWVTVDIDGQTRNDTTPDIGADEFGDGLQTNDGGVLSIIAPESGCGLSSTESVTVRVQNYGVDTLSGFDVTYVLNGSSVTENIGGMNVPGGESRDYTFSATVDLSTVGTYTLEAYTAILSDPDLTNDTVSTSIESYAPVNVTVTSDTSTCSGSSVTLSASGANSYQWRVEGSSSIFSSWHTVSVSPTSTTSYVVSTTNSDGCMKNDTIEVIALALPPTPTITVDGNTTLCQDDTLTLTSNITSNIQWSNGANTASIFALNAGVYTVTHTDTLTGCTSSASVTLSHQPSPYISGNTNICEGASTSLSVVYGDTYLWSTGATTQSISVAPTTTTTYTVSVTNASGCNYSRSVTVNVTPAPPPPTITSISPDVSICEGGNTSLSVSGSASYFQWNTGNTGTLINVSPTATTDYIVTAHGGTCSTSTVSDTVTVTVLAAPPTPILTSSAPNFCGVDTIQLTVANFTDSVQWSTGATTASIDVTQTGTYSATHIGTNGCNASASTSVTNPPAPYISGPLSLCLGESITLTVINGSSFLWSTGATSPTITATPTTDTTFTVSVQAIGGCSYSLSQSLTVLPSPEIDQISSDTTICGGASVTLSVSGNAVDFNWSTGQTGNSITVSPLGTTDYTVTATNGIGCTTTDNASVRVSTLPLPPKPVILPGDIAAICEGDSVTLSSSVVSGELAWSNGGMGTSITVADTGLYTVVLTDTLTGCSNNDSATVVFPTAPTIATSAVPAICLGDSLTLTIQDATSYTWSTGATTVSITVSPTDTTTYSVASMNAFGCAYQDSLEVAVLQPSPPSMVSNMLPTDNSNGVTTPINFSWAPATNASHYDLYIWPDTVVGRGTPTATDITQISYQYSGIALAFGTTYKWQLVSKNSCFETDGPVQRFTLRELPDLIVDTVMAPPTIFSGQLLSVSWEVNNQGAGSTGSTQWIDAIYLSTDSLYDPGIDTYLGGVSNLTALNGGESYAQTASFNLPQGLAGTYYVIIRTDAYGGVHESSTANNQGNNIGGMLISLPPLPDLQVTSVVSPLTTFSGQTISMNWTVTNEGSGATNVSSWSDRVYLGTDPTFTSGATVLGTFTHTGLLSPDSSYTQVRNVTIPNGIFGTYYIHVRTDFYDNVYEHAFEGNNRGRNDSISIILTPPPNLLVTNVQGPTSATNRENILVDWTVENQGGSATVEGVWYDRIYLCPDATFNTGTAIYLGTRTHNGNLGVGNSYSQTAALSVPSNITGAYYLYVITDYTNRVFEYNNDGDNTTRSSSVINILTPDLTVDSVTVASMGTSGQSFSIDWMVDNNGGGDLLSVSRRDRIMLSSHSVYHPDSVTQLGTVTYSTAIAATGSISKQASYVLPNGISGIYYIYIDTDYLDQVHETDDNNNIARSIAITIQQGPWADLTPTAVVLPDSAVAGEAVSIVFTIQNAGMKDILANSNWRDRVFLSPSATWDPGNAIQIKDFFETRELNADSSYTTTTSAVLPMLPTTVQTNICYIYVYTDATDVVYENTDEGNNVMRSNPIFVTNYLPDLVVTSYGSADTAYSGQQTCVAWTVVNRSERPYQLLDYSYWYDGVFLSTDTIWDAGDTFLWDWAFFGTTIGDSIYTMPMEWFDLPNGISGDFYILMVADHTGEIPEAELDNNVRHYPVRINLTPPPDLTISTFNAPSNGTAGQPIDISWTVDNNGTGKTRASWVDRVYLSTDFTLDNGDIPLDFVAHSDTLFAGQSYTDSMEVYLPVSASGNYILLMVTDDGNTIYEHMAEGNNVESSFIAIYQPPPSDLVITEITAPTSAIVGDPLTISWKVANQGANPASGVMSGAVYLSTDTIWDVDDELVSTVQGHINMAPATEITRSISSSVPGVPLGDYYVLVRTDILNNIYESNDTNNVQVASHLTSVDVRELFLNIPATPVMTNNEGIFYRLEIADSLYEETLLVTLDGDSLNGNNELYIRHGAMPDRVVYDYSHTTPFAGDVEAVVPELDSGTYYIFVYGFTTAGSSQSLNILARILDFEIRSVEVDEGGNTGNVTVKISGAKFQDNMAFRLEGAGLDTITATNLHFVDPSVVFVTFPLNGADLGMYNVVGEKPEGQTASLVNGFEVVEGTEPTLAKIIQHPPNARVNRVVTITIEFANGGNIDLELPSRFLVSLYGSAIGFSVQDLQYGFRDLFLEFREPNGPPDVLRPGASSSYTVYTISVSRGPEGRLRFKLIE